MRRPRVRSAAHHTVGALSDHDRALHGIEAHHRCACTHLLGQREDGKADVRREATIRPRRRGSRAVRARVGLGGSHASAKSKGERDCAHEPSYPTVTDGTCVMSGVIVVV